MDEAQKAAARERMAKARAAKAAKGKEQATEEVLIAGGPVEVVLQDNASMVVRTTELYRGEGVLEVRVFPMHARALVMTEEGCRDLRDWTLVPGRPGRDGFALSYRMVKGLGLAAGDRVRIIVEKVEAEA